MLRLVVDNGELVDREPVMHYETREDIRKRILERLDRSIKHDLAAQDRRHERRVLDLSAEELPNVVRLEDYDL